MAVLDSTIEANRAEDGGGIYAPLGASLDLSGTTVIGNVAAMSGGGVVLEDASLVGGTLTENTSLQPPDYRAGPSTPTRGSWATRPRS